MSIDYSERIPNNVDLAEDRRLQRALESWQPRFLQWWGEMGPTTPAQASAVTFGRVGWDAGKWFRDASVGGSRGS